MCFIMSIGARFDVIWLQVVCEGRHLMQGAELHRFQLQAHQHRIFLGTQRPQSGSRVSVHMHVSRPWPGVSAGPSFQDRHFHKDHDGGGTFKVLQLAAKSQVGLRFGQALEIHHAVQDRPQDHQGHKMIDDDMKLFHSDDLIYYASEEIMSWIAMIVSVSYT